jgi:hypothetical protein
MGCPFAKTIHSQSATSGLGQLTLAPHSFPLTTCGSLPSLLQPPHPLSTPSRPFRDPHLQIMLSIARSKSSFLLQKVTNKSSAQVRRVARQTSFKASSCPRSIHYTPSFANSSSHFSKYIFPFAIAAVPIAVVACMSRTFVALTFPSLYETYTHTFSYYNHSS